MNIIQVIPINDLMNSRCFGSVEAIIKAKIGIPTTIRRRDKYPWPSFEVGNFLIIKQTLIQNKNEKRT